MSTKVIARLNQTKEIWNSSIPSSYLCYFRLARLLTGAEWQSECISVIIWRKEREKGTANEVRSIGLGCQLGLMILAFIGIQLDMRYLSFCHATLQKTLMVFSLSNSINESTSLMVWESQKIRLESCELDFLLSRPQNVFCDLSGINF